METVILSTAAPHVQQSLITSRATADFSVCIHFKDAYLVVHFEAGEHGVFKAYVHSDYMVDQCVGFMGLQGGGDGQSGGCVSVQNIHQLLFLYGSYTKGGRQKKDV